ncbi:GGDEF domain-containing protein [Photobacterium sp. OFAV2-7]|uniref:GGDEF domain-containing protein n=1 Tax=Photobacterium sp. OFAV2-7 TaxID=2917748 RepID=UPI001EF46C6A|nr:GGDEF domain-containing protein [Photobacterium sp. OFAV2-7]MCG7585386.1 GGDEF domain-containing protein [Photobacterium sp. OFAV2-7]
MTQTERLDNFYQRILEQWGKAHGLRTVCELTCRNLSESFSAYRAQLVVAYKSQWKILLEMNDTGIHYQFPPVDISDRNSIPFFQVTRAIRQRTPKVELRDGYTRLCLPLERRSHIIGCLIVDFPEHPIIEGSEFTFLAALMASELDACLLSESIQDEHDGRRSAERELQISQQEQQLLKEQLQALHDISFKLWRAGSMDNMLFTAVEEAKKLLLIDRMAIFLFKGKNRMQGTYGTDIHGKTVNEHYFEEEIPDLWFTKINKDYRRKEYLAIEENTPLFHELKQVGFGWSAYISLWDEDTPVGWIACDNLLTGTPLHNYHQQLLKQFGFIVSQHLVRRQAEENLINLNKELEQRVSDRTAELEKVNRKLEKISRLDPLTSVSNRRVFDRRINEEWRRAERHQLPLSLLIIDVDLFKAYNDSYGHAAGDQCLKIIANTLATQEKRAGALFARYGGEEFVLLLPGQDKSAARYAAQRAIHAIRELQLPRSQGVSSAPDIVTISIGISTTVPSVQSSPGEFFKQADGALYEAKSLGRNQYYEHT